MSLHASIREQLRRQFDPAVADPAADLNGGLRLLSKWRSVLIQNTVLHHQGTVVMQGPLKGLDFLPQSAEGCHVAKLLGCYEQPLQPHIEQAIAQAYDLLVNIGCAEGYYAVGMARRMPATRVLAFDLDETARRTCAALARKNGVEGRIEIGQRFTVDDFAVCEGRRSLVLCDIEGAERELLQPALSPALASADLIVESHECLRPGLTRELIARFEPTHHVTVVHDDGQRRLHEPPAWFLQLAHLDQLLATWEWRSGPTPWLVMNARRRAH